MVIDDITGMLRDAVAFSVPAPPDDRLSAFACFALISDPSDLNSDTLMKSIRYKDLPYFYSRRWDDLNQDPSLLAFEYPLLVMEKMSISGEELFSHTQRLCWSIELSALYPDQEAVEYHAQHLSQHVTREEISVRMAFLLSRALDYVSACVFATTDVKPEGAWYHPGLLQAMASAGEISSYSIQEQKTMRFKRSLREENKRQDGIIVQHPGKDNLFGVSLRLRICEECDEALQPLQFKNRSCCI